MSYPQFTVHFGLMQQWNGNYDHGNMRGPLHGIWKKIIQFGFHLVPVGYPHSDVNMIEWRISFSVAERTLVWSFNHIQMQCYAV